MAWWLLDAADELLLAGDKRRVDFDVETSNLFSWKLWLREIPRSPEEGEEDDAGGDKSRGLLFGRNDLEL